MVHPVAILRAVFCVICSLLMFVWDAIGDQMVLAYSRIGRVIVLYVVIRVSFCFPQVVDVSAFRILIDLSAFSFVASMCLWKVSFGSKVSPSILGFLTVGIRVLLMCRCSVVLYSAGSGVNSVEVDLSAFSMRSLS